MFLIIVKFFRQRQVGRIFVDACWIFTQGIGKTFCVNFALFVRHLPLQFQRCSVNISVPVWFPINYYISNFFKSPDARILVPENKHIYYRPIYLVGNILSDLLGCRSTTTSRYGLQTSGGRPPELRFVTTTSIFNIFFDRSHTELSRSQLEKVVSPASADVTVDPSFANTFKASPRSLVM